VKKPSIFRKFKNFRRAFKKDLSFRVLKCFASSGFLASVYYLFFSPEFRRENHAVLNGRMRYQTTLEEVGESSALLRRNIHRLEKGLIMRPRRSVFAEDFIEETVKHFLDCDKSNVVNENEIKWARDVLSEYFSVVGDSERLGKARKLFGDGEVANKAQGDDHESYTPYSRSSVSIEPVSYESFHELCTLRRSVRWYDQVAVPIELVRKAVNSASLAPSACNRQPFSFCYIEDRRKIVDVANCATGTKGFSENIPRLVVVIGDLSCFPLERDRHLIYIDGALAAMQLMLSLETLGLSSCPINWPDIEERERKISSLLELRPEQRPVMLISLGYADPEGKIPYSQKKSDALLLKEV